MKDIIKARARSNKWKRSESGKLWLYEYRRRQDVKERQKYRLRVRRNNPLVKEKEREYYDKIKERLEARKQTTEWRDKRHKWLESPNGKAYNTVQGARRRYKIKGGQLTTQRWLMIKNRSPLCSMCGRFVECQNLTLDHIIPLSKGGRHIPSNVQALCKSCNSSKHDKIPEFIFISPNKSGNLAEI